MAFYEQLSKYYDQVFPAYSVTSQLLLELAGDKSEHILDVACGTGSYAEILAQAGHIVQACDLDQKMADRAGQREGVKAFAADMSFLAEHEEVKLFAGSYKLIYCIGNSLVHLPDKEAINKAVAGMVSLLAPDGILLLQIINYDRILDYNIDGLPTIKNTEAGISFTRHYFRSKENERIIFQTELNIENNKGHQSFKNEVLLYPLRSNDLLEILRKSGLENVEKFGGFAKEAFDIDASVPLIVVGRKK